MPSTTLSTVSVVLDFLGRDHAFAANLIHGVSDKLSDRRGRCGRRSAATCAFSLRVFDGPRERSERLDRALRRTVETTLDINRRSLPPQHCGRHQQIWR